MRQVTAMLTDNQAKYIQEVAAKTGKCDHCSQTINIYRYKLNATMADFLLRMRDRVEQSGSNDVDISTLAMPYSQHTQMTKLRLHGLIARVKDPDGVQIGNHWLITNKGGDWLRGNPVPEKVVVFNNQVLGHDGKNVTMHEVLGRRGKPEAEQEGLTPAEATTYHNVRKAVKPQVFGATFKGSAYGESNGLKKDLPYMLEVGRMQMGLPVAVRVQLPHGRHLDLSYRDIAAFQKHWKVS